MDQRGPFGLRMGMALDEVPDPVEEVAPFTYQTTRVPLPHRAFESYVLQITPQLGLSWIKGIGVTISTSSFGFELRSEFESMEQRLSAIYGVGDRTDFLIAGSIWDEARDFMQGLLSHERYLLTKWDASQGSTLKGSLVTVGLVASAIDTGSGYLALEYYFTNAAAATELLASLEDDAL